MKRILIAGILGVAELCHGEIDEQRLANAIYKAEGGERARVPYGILSVPVHSEAEARRVCLRTIHHQIAKWEATGRQGDVFSWIGAAYCPASSDPIGNKNWTHNVSWLYFHSKVS
jgi:hypothetical protein